MALPKNVERALNDARCALRKLDASQVAEFVEFMHTERREVAVAIANREVEACTAHGPGCWDAACAVREAS